MLQLVAAFARFALSVKKWAGLVKMKVVRQVCCKKNKSFGLQR
jgi:hypothetical protein